jgi:hypothetical protein
VSSRHYCVMKVRHLHGAAVRSQGQQHRSTPVWRFPA